MIHLPPRLLALAGLIPPGARVLDVGTDHAKLPIWLMQNGAATQVTATDLHEKPLRRAEETIRRCGLLDKITLLRRDGLIGLPLHCFDVVVIAGLSGETIATLLPPLPETVSPVFLLQPVTHADRLRAYLRQNGFVVTREVLAHEDGRIYPIMEARRQPPPHGVSPDEVDTVYVSGALLRRQDPLLPAYLRRVVRRLTYETQGLARSSKPGDALRLAAHRRDLRILEDILTAWENGREHSTTPYKKGDNP